MTSAEATNSVFNINDENNSFLVTIPCHWNSKSAKKTNDKLNKILHVRSENDIELHTRKVGKRYQVLEMLGPDPNNPKNIVTIGVEMYYLNDLDTRKNELLSDLKGMKFHDLQDMVYRMQLHMMTP